MLGMCTCSFRSNMTWDELLEEVVIPEKYCTSTRMTNSPGWICPTLNKELRRADQDRQRREQYNKRLRKQGLSKDEINARPMKKGRKQVVAYGSVNL